jgi:hypothetical protein
LLANLITAATAKAIAVDTPRTFLLKPAALLQAKRQIMQKDPAMQKALDDLLRDADKTLSKGPYSVVYKSKVPPSGDKHDYMSVGPYWWPDPSKPDGLPYIRKDGQINPERYAVKDLDFHQALCRDVYTLGLAWFYTGKPAYAAHAAKLLRTWFVDTATRMNPNLNYGQAIPGITEGRGIGLIDMHNVTRLLDGIQLLKGAPELPAADYEAIRQWHRDFLQWMRTSPIGLDEADEHNNHGTWYDVQAVAIALFTGQPDLAGNILKEQTQKRIDAQLKEDGSQPHELARTLSWNYSGFNLSAFFELALLAENVGIDLWHYESPGKKSLKRAFTYLLPYAEKVKTWEYKQIKPMEVTDYLRLAKVAGRQYPDVDMKQLWEQHKDYNSSMLMLTSWSY